MHYAILRTAKLKTFGNVGGSLSHTFRTRETPNADTARAGENEHSTNTPQQVMEALKNRLPDKYRKDAVIGLEYFVGASPDWFPRKDKETQDRYFKDALEWLQKRHGKENVVGWSIHRDESSPHLVVYVVPIKDGKLNAKAFTGGKVVLSKMQTDFAQAMRLHGLDRGIEGSKAHHQTIKDWYGQVNSTPPLDARITPEMVTPQVLEKGIFSKTVETPEMVAKRVERTVEAAYSKPMQTAKTAHSDRARALQLEKTALSLAEGKKEAENHVKSLMQHLQPLVELSTLAQGEVKKLLEHARQRVAEIKAEKAKAIEAEKLAKAQQIRPRSGRQDGPSR